MARQQQQDIVKTPDFKQIILLKDQILGVGSYGEVCKATCDDLLCAAKIIHPTLSDPTALHQIEPNTEHLHPISRFLQEFDFLMTIHHPNIVQYLGMHQDLDTGMPVLLMELMDDSLTHFLESSPLPIPYHIQVTICHDISLALSFLHSNRIIHSDLSSNNVLLIGNVRAKVTDFGMAERRDDQNSQASQLTLTMCPGTDVYMPPEAVKDEPEYTEKIDCFSFGVITIQIVTRQFPKPGDRQVTLDDPHYPQGVVKQCVPEIKRRQNHISLIDPNHPLKRVALDCLKDRDVERPSAHQLCERVADLKKGPQYSESVRAVEAKSTAEQDRSDERLRSLTQQHSQQIQGLQQIIQSQKSHSAEKDRTITNIQQEKDRFIRSLRLQYSRSIEGLRQSQRNKLDEKDRMIVQKAETIAKLREQIRQLEREKGVIVEEKERELRQKMDEKNQLILLRQQQIFFLFFFFCFVLFCLFFSL